MNKIAVTYFYASAVSWGWLNKYYPENFNNFLNVSVWMFEY